MVIRVSCLIKTLDYIPKKLQLLRITFQKSYNFAAQNEMSYDQKKA